MALASTSAFASFDVNSLTQVLDISSDLSEALLLDFEFMGKGITVAMDDPVEDTTFTYNAEALNADVVSVAASATSTATTLTLSTGHGARLHIGDLLKDKAINKTEVMEVTDISSDTATVVRAYNSTTATSVADAAVLSIMPAYQEASDIGSDKSPKPTALSNYTQIVFPGDLIISRSQIKRAMATVAMDVDRQLANRVKELKRFWTTISIYGEKSASAGSDTVYRTTLGLKGWIRDNSGITNSASAALALSNLNTVNTSIVNTARYSDTLLIGTDLVGSVTNIENSNRQLLESDTKVGYVVQYITLAQGNTVEVVTDGRVHTGDAFLYTKADLRWRPLVDSAMFLIAATDFVDGVKRRIGSEAGIEMRYPGSAAWISNKT